jgi:multiple antibiotic resistance protein
LADDSVPVAASGYTWPVPDFVFNAFVTLLVVVDPLGLAPIFAALTQGSSEKRKRETAIRGTLLGAGILLAFALVGDALLGALGIGLPAFRIAGGILLFVLALDMVFARPSGMRARTVREQEEEEYGQDITVFPLAIPLIAGPGGITTVLLYTGGRDAGGVAVFVAVLLAVLALTLVSLLLASRVMRLFGETGANVLSRVLGVLLAALAVQFVIDGLQSSFGS